MLARERLQRRGGALWPLEAGSEGPTKHERPLIDRQANSQLIRVAKKQRQRQRSRVGTGMLPRTLASKPTSGTASLTVSREEMPLNEPRLVTASGGDGRPEKTQALDKGMMRTATTIYRQFERLHGRNLNISKSLSG